MQNSRLYELLKSLDNSELKKFVEFAESPYFNKNSNVIKLSKHLIKCVRDDKTGKLEKKEIYSVLFSGKPYNDKVMRNLMSETLKLGENFLGYEFLEKQILDKNYYILNGLIYKKLFRILTGVMERTEELLKNSPFSEEYFYFSLQILSYKRAYGSGKLNKLEKLDDVRILLEPLLAFFCLYFFKINSMTKTHQADYNVKVDFTADLKFISGIIEYVKSKSMETEPVILIYYNIFMSIYKPDEEIYFIRFRKLLDEFKNKFSETEKHNFYTISHTYCQHRIQMGDRRYFQIKFELDKVFLAEGSLQTENLHPVEYKNFVKSGIGAAEHQWTLKFIEDYKDKLISGFDNNLYNYCLALTYFRMREIQKAMSFLALVNYENVYDKLDVKCLMLQLFYESNALEELRSQIDAFNRFLKNDTLINNVTKVPLNLFIDSVKKLLKFREDGCDGLQLSKFRKELAAAIIHDRSWFMEKLDKLEGRIKS